MLSLSISEYSEYSTTELLNYIRSWIKKSYYRRSKITPIYISPIYIIYIHQFRIILTEIIGQTAISLNAHRFNTINMYARRKSQ